MSTIPRTYRYLARDEKLYHVCRQHWIVLARPLGIWLGSVVLALAIGMLLGAGAFASLMDQLLAWLVLGTTFYVAVQYFRWLVVRFVISNQRVLFIEGLVAQKVSAIPLSKVTDTTFTRSFLGQLLNYGDLLLDSPGEHPGIATLVALPEPDWLYRLVMSLAAGEEPSPRALHPPGEEDTGEIPRVVL